MARSTIAVLTVVALLVGAVFVVASFWIFGWGGFMRSTAEHRGETAATERIEADGDYRIAAYEQFFDKCASVQTTEATIAALEDELKTGPSAGRADQIASTLTALRANRADAINTYNADAAKEATRAQFQASGLPDRLNIEEETTTCEAN